MTAQISDTFLFNGEQYELIAMTEGDLFSPQQFGMEPEMLHTACYRGFYATYELTDTALCLRELAIRERSGTYVPIGNIQPKMLADKAVYDNLEVVIPFSGKIRLAKDFIQEMYIHMGFQKPTAFGTVLDITLENGKVTQVNDRSEEIAEKRGAFKEYYNTQPSLRKIDLAFSLDMELE